jgi:2-polyprenyl-3-methyl-5-hydroxy-6-metoxy-1,4-benzoquinol methylase
VVASQETSPRRACSELRTSELNGDQIAEILVTKPARQFSQFESLTCCCLCDSARISRRFFPDIWICKDCSVLFRNPRQVQKEIIDSYDSGILYSAWQKELEVRDFLWKKRLNILLRFKKSGSLLDVGTGDGFFLDFAKESFSVSATEVSENGARYARRKGYSPLIGDISEISFDDGKSYDVITLWHVLEHLPFPGAALRILRKLLSPGGVMIIAVPNEQRSLIVHRLKKAKGTPFGMLNWGTSEIHLTHFTPRVLSRYLLRNGFKILEMDVDDVHLERTWSTTIGLNFNRLLNRVLKVHLDNAMYVVCTRVDY